VWIDRNEVLRAPATGVWQAAVEPMQALAAGTLVGRLTDPWGTVLHEVRAPFPSIVLYVVTTPPVTEGEPLAGLGGVAAGAPA
jgi:predicted deacylase